MSTDAPKLSPVEKIKQDSEFLKGSIDTEMAADTDHFGKEDIQLLKFHGTYQQDDRDKRVELKKSGGGKAYSMMVRCRIPGGRITSDQMLAQLDLCDELGNSTLKITTRQTIQLHGVLKRDLRDTINRINEIELSTLAACGDVNRNIMCCPAKNADGVHQEMLQLTDALTEALAPQTPAYHELWITDPDTGEKTLQGGGPVVEPLYGPTYLPRKFKIGIALPEDNCIDIYTQDLGFLAVVRDAKVIGYNVLVGGGMGTTPALKRTYPALAKRMAFCTPDQAVDVAKAVIKVQRDHGNRADRKVARMKYLVDEWGVEKFRRSVEEYYGQPLKDCTEDDVTGFDDHMGWQDQGDGLWSYGLNIENGRIYDDEQRQLKSLMREICQTFGTELRMTGHQSIIVTDLQEQDKDRLIEIIQRHKVPTTEQTSTVRRWSIACVALPTCGLAITESERRLPSIIDGLEQPLAKLGLDKERFTVRMTGCPNGCARPYNADIALVGKAKDKYTLYVGGGWLGNRLGYIYKDLVPDADIVDEIVGIAAAFKANRNADESLGDFCDRVGKDDLAVLAAAAERP
ncbi:NADPH-dependent assimilatory sulfite reductase hemoprotein subunit [Roseiconus nitratireducens]|uniref:NADPH-dependent assimilatory sulfite reductase hemoprotein subunit n=1 Tax=Roseiconus nitratireducens TaxID=2605748 RepID=A0A5M6DGG8_9BACT|nr:NADPH-dependent assimilatory sulfite reductase hemoprotein subunit [Roseiconus nitratireducens]KAA5545299.1 NADPH-dependent assimilatory sulfite reductase hemoprotein subunit [Roseiconus nitratireducens]